VTIGKATLHLAATDRASAEARVAIREALGPLVERLRHELSLTADALGGPDPEYALSLFADILHEMPAAMRALEAELSGARHLRVAA
jgi:hypothetical protein